MNEPNPTRAISVNPRRLPPHGFHAELSRQLANTSIDGAMSIPGAGNRSVVTPWNTPFCCEIDTSDPLMQTVVCGARRLNTDYPFEDTIMMPAGMQPITKVSQETATIGVYSYGWAGYLVDMRWNTATFTTWDPAGGYPYYTNDHMVPVVLAKTIHQNIGGVMSIRNIAPLHWGMIDCRWWRRYMGPFDVWFYGSAPAYRGMVEVGHTRTYGPIWGQRYDRIVVHPDVILQGYPEIAIQCNGDGYIVKRIIREATISADASIWVSAVPGNTAFEYWAVLAQVKWDYALGEISDILQHQYGDIVIDRTTVNYCPP